jgi:hypothetical protein
MDRGIAAVDRDYGSVHTKVAPGLRKVLLHITTLEARHEGGVVRYIITLTSDGRKRRCRPTKDARLPAIREAFKSGRLGAAWWLRAASCCRSRQETIPR